MNDPIGTSLVIVAVVLVVAIVGIVWLFT